MVRALLRRHMRELIIIVFLLAVGILLLVNPAAFASWLVKVAGLFLMVLGALRIIRYFRAEAEAAAKGQDFFIDYCYPGRALLCDKNELVPLRFPDPGCNLRASAAGSGFQQSPEDGGFPPDEVFSLVSAGNQRTHLPGFRLYHCPSSGHGVYVYLGLHWSNNDSGSCFQRGLHMDAGKRPTSKEREREEKSGTGPG